MAKGDLVRSVRLSLDMNLREFSELSGIARSLLSRIENGYNGVGPQLAARLEKKTGVPARYWLGVSGE